ncbi:Ig-like domain-containing protein [Limnobaculum xujianqingii]|uniref:hypothetical protein n=1 Tax=Limnobaculum xujianqingii TaxID=2738837 RepID=UPI0015C13E17|nr:hypothetical protein [Limnobaculum xujianqingii]
MGDRLLGSTTVGGDGKWALRPDTALSTGKNEFTAVEMDPVGNKAGPSAGYEILLAGNPPQPPTIDRVEDNVGPTTGALQKAM